MSVGLAGKMPGKLEIWTEKLEASPELIEFYRRLLRIQSITERRVGIPWLDLNSETINDRLEQGLPLIRFDELDLDWPLLQATFVEVNSAFAKHPKLFGPVPKSLVETRGYHHYLKETVRAWYEMTRLPTAVVPDGVDECLLEDIILATLKPFLAAYSKALASCVDQDRWRRGNCPICGGNPDFAFLDKEYGARWLLCSRCDTEWLFQRLECPYCGNRNQNTLAYFTDDDRLYRLYICEQCTQYLKAIDLRQAKEEVVVPHERLFTLPLDAQARDYGCSRGDKAGAKVKGHASADNCAQAGG
jgi:FdhE protein